MRKTHGTLVMNLYFHWN